MRTRSPVFNTRRARNILMKEPWLSFARTDDFFEPLSRMREDL